MRYFKISILLSIGLLAAFIGKAQPVKIDKVVAVVGDNIILHSDIEAQYQQMATQNPDVELPEGERCTIFDNLLLDKLFLAQAQIDSVTVSTEEVDAELDRRIRYFITVFGSREKLEDYYGKKVLELKDDFRDDIQKQLLSDKMKGKAFSGLKVSPAEVKDFYDRIPKDSVPFFNSELELGQIVMNTKVSQQAKDYVRKKLEDIRTEIIQGADFGAKAILYSEDGSRMEGGSLGWTERGEMVPEFEAVVYRLKEGVVSEVFETPFGFHLALVDEKRGDRLLVRHILIRPKITNTDRRITAERMDSILHLLRVDSLSWREAVNKFSDDEQSKSIGGMMTNTKTGNSFFEKPDIEGTLAAHIDNMKVGEYSNVLVYAAPDRTGQTVEGFRIVWLKSETKPHKASLDLDYAKIQAAAKAEKQQKALEDWVKLHRPKNYVRIDDSMKDCPGISKWLN